MNNLEKKVMESQEKSNKNIEKNQKFKIISKVYK